MCLINAGQSEKPLNKIDQQLLDAFNVDRSLRMKRPFCNAFTGCGRKRSFSEYLTDLQELKSSDSIRIPVSLYKALLNAAQTACGRSTVDMNEYQSSEVPQVYMSGKIGNQKRYEMPLTSLD
ncbi:hypothetical protein WH47_05276 [Habropoda laboriosa]|uniref:Cardioactive peptide n=2 Tax=Habropoda laboriosa TaxID=597456 RepID=A0A0L7QVQ8_9HYME|nr:hypothetical protein WH47_05276 [Habropoda laboriosa]